VYKIKVIMSSSRKKLLHREFESSLERTERNLSSIKGKLNVNPRRYQSNVGKLSLFNNDIIKDQSLLASSSFNKNNNERLFDISNSSNVITSLLKRIDEQSKTVSNMNDTVQHLTNEIYKVKERQKELETQLQSSSGPSVENLQRELRNEVETLHALYRDNTSIDNGGHHKLVNELTKDLRQHKKYVENEMDSLRREMDNIKSRIS